MLGYLFLLYILYVLISDINKVNPRSGGGNGRRVEYLRDSGICEK